MKIVFFGTSEFAVPSLKALLASKHKVVCAVTQPDRKRGRMLKLSPTPIKSAALSSDIPVYQPEDASSADSAAYLKELGADLFVVVSFGQILKKDILSIPKIFSVNVHGSLLPKYRGAAPTNWAIIKGERTTGVTVIRMNEKMDEGDIILKEQLPIGCEDTNITLSEKLSGLGASALMKVVKAIDEGVKNIVFTAQSGPLASYAPKLKKEDGLIDWKDPAADINNKVRGSFPWPGAYTHYDGRILKILMTAIVDGGDMQDAAPGTVIGSSAQNGILVRTGSGAIAIKYLKPEGKKEMDAGAFLLGHKLPKGYLFR